ncbi:MAG: hypothetical protein WA999_03460 [Spirulinaceae cyanobacterium]
MFSKKIPFFITFATFSLFPIAANALSLGGVMDNGPGDLDPEIGSIVVAGLGVSVLSTTIPGNVDIDVDAKANASDNGVTLSILGTIINDTNEELSFILTSSVSYNLDVDVPEDGFIFAGLNASLFDLNPFGLPTSNGANATTTAFVNGFAPNTVSTSDSIPANVVIAGENAGLFGRETIKGMLLQNNGTVTVETIGSLGPGQALRFNNSFDGGFAIPEPDSSVSILAVGILGIATWKRNKFKPR